MQGAALLAAAIAAAAVLVVDRPSARTIAALLAPLLAAAALLAMVGDDLSDTVSRRPALAGAAAGAGVVVLAVVAALLRSRPAVFAVLVFVALPFRVPVPIGDDNANLLVPLYGVIAAGVLAAAMAWWRSSSTSSAAPEAHAAAPAFTEATGLGGRVRWLRIALAAVLVVYAAQALYSTDLDEATKNLCFFYVPFALLFRLLLDVPWSQRLLLWLFGAIVGLAVLFAAIGFVEYATGELVVSNAKVLETTELKGYFRVNSLFFDPNIFGRFLALTMTALAAALLWTRRSRDVPVIAVILAVLWAGLVLSLSQSSFAALLCGLAVLAALRWRVRPVLVSLLVAGLGAIAAVLLAGSSIGISTHSDRAIDKATSGRFDLVTGALRMARDRPGWGFGSGAFAERYRAREQVRTPNGAAVSHTTPLTVAAEQGLIGLIPYFVLLWCAFLVLFDGVTRAVRGASAGIEGVVGAAVAAAFCGLLLHTFVYASFLEDPLTWVLLAVAAGVGPAWRAAGAAAVGVRAPAAAPAGEESGRGVGESSGPSKGSVVGPGARPAIQAP